MNLIFRSAIATITTTDEYTSLTLHTKHRDVNATPRCLVACMLDRHERISFALELCPELVFAMARLERVRDRAVNVAKSLSASELEAFYGLEEGDLADDVLRKD
jgi:hypothetical protein